MKSAVGPTRVVPTCRRANSGENLEYHGVDDGKERTDGTRGLQCKRELIVEDEQRYDIRPLVTAGRPLQIKLHERSNKWNKDRGKDIDSAPRFMTFGGECMNDHQTALAEENQARAAQAVHLRHG